MKRREITFLRGTWWGGALGLLAIGLLITTAVAVHAADIITANIPKVTLEVPIGSTGSVTGLAQYISIFYRFAVSAVAIMAATMIMYAGISWLTAAGNTQRISEAKERIIAAISGLIIAMMSFVILNTINPQLIALQNPGLSLTNVSLSSTSTTTSGTCAEATEGDCIPSTLDKLSSGCFGTEVNHASAICYAESLGENKESSSDKCSDNNAFSVGYFQINMIANGSLISGCDAKNIYTWGSGGSSTPPKNPDGSYNCKVKDATLYATCKAKFMDPAENIKAACKISRNGATWNPWSTNKICGFKP